MTTHRKSRQKVNRIAIYTVLITFAAGCSNMKTVAATDAPSVSSQLVIGEEIRITRNDGTDVTFAMTYVTREGIAGRHLFVAFSDIHQFQTRLARTRK